MKAININDYNNYQISESTIINRILAGEKELYEILLRRNNQKLYRVIRSYIKDDAEIEDLMQNTHLKAFQKLYQFKQTATYSTWLIRIGINEALARLKEKKKTYTLTQQNQFESTNTILEIPDKTQLTPEKIIINEETKRILENAIDSLTLKYKTVYILKEVENMSIQQIADCLDISASNVKVRVHRAKIMLKDRLFELTKNDSIYEFGFSRCDRITEYIMRHI